MLQRTDQRERHRARAAERKRRYRCRSAMGRAVYLVELDGAVLDLLIRLRWLGEANVGDRTKVAHAVSQMLADTARRS